MPKVVMPKDHPQAAVIVAGQRVERGKTVDVDPETAAALKDQGWTSPAAKKSAATKAANPTKAEPSASDASDDADPKES